MVAARTAAKSLSTTDLEQIRDTLGSGRKPKVMFTDAAGQIAGQIGQVIALTDPELSDEWVVVRFGKDELPFSPTDLMIAPKAAPTRRAPAVPSPREESPVPAASAPSTVDAPVPADAPRSPDAEVPAPEVVGGDAASGDGGAVTGAVAGEVKPEVKAEAKSAERVPGRPAPAKKAAKPKAPPGLTVTLAYAEGEWTVAANQGAKALAKPYLIKASEALKMVSMLDVPGVHEAVEEIVSAARAEAEQQAERLRAELAEIEARLAELSDAE
jgi:hypothetical protein